MVVPMGASGRRGTTGKRTGEPGELPASHGYRGGGVTVSQGRYGGGECLVRVKEEAVNVGRSL